MKKLLFLALFLTITAAAQAPARLFDVRNGNGIVDNGTAQPVATYIVYKDAAAKAETIDALCALGNYDALAPATRPTRQAFANNEIKAFLREKVKQHRQQLEHAKIVAPNEADLP